MFEKKNFVLNCNVCDARKIKEEDWASYEKIILNADLLLVDERSKSILNKLPIVSNIDETMELDEDINLISQNGNYEISGNTPVAPNTVICVNGNLTIAPDTQEVLKSIRSIHVNGNVTCPDSLNPYLSMLSLNGNLNCYPGDCIVMPSHFVIDRYFPMRTRQNGRYYAKDTVLLTDGDTDIRPLLDKNVRFKTDRFVVAQKYLEAAVSMVDENVALTVIPSGLTFVDGDAELTESLLAKYGKNLYIYGHLTLQKESLSLLSQIEKLHVDGNVNLYEEQLEAFRKIPAQYQELCIIADTQTNVRVIENKMHAKIDSFVLDASPDGLVCRNCASVSIHDTVTTDQILDKLRLENCASVQCSPAQRSAVETASQNVAVIQDGEETQGAPSIIGLLGDLLHSRIVNSDSYNL